MITPRPNPNNLPDIARHPFLVTCDKPNCHLRIACSQFDEAADIDITHSCPYPANVTETVQAMYEGRTIAKANWELLDTWMDEYVPLSRHCATSEFDVTAHTRKTLLQGMMMGMADAIVQVSAPPLQTTEAISREVLRRYQERQAGRVPQTPGVEIDAYIKPFVRGGRPLVNPIPGQGEPYEKPLRMEAPAPEPEPIALDPALARKIRNALNSGAFTRSQICEVMDVTVAQIDAAVAMAPSD